MAPKFVSFVAAPDNMNATALPTLTPEFNIASIRGMVPPPHTYKGTPMLAVINAPNSLYSRKNSIIFSEGI